ncbi:hypothetical protein SAMN05216588_13144 [Pseudomonas flavescens]|uniref:Uncharacterized protein n=1 Tax=Phytopseudomonas flavescens TaxID=29435 RepID=A0A1G8PX79_9GAMM|nr:hypothetical protein [Pseudomonas flavescens]SDI97091.1 hypothetical protein SAMN05216588_13144 [Pseudomonas flavescens]
MHQVAPIREVDYELSRESLEAFMLEQRQRQKDAIKQINGGWLRVRNGAYIGAAVVMTVDLLIAGTLTAISAIAIGLILLGMWAKAKAQAKLAEMGAGAPQPKWLIRRLLNKRIFKGREHMSGSVRFYADRVVVDQGGSHFESAYEGDKIDLIIQSPGYLQLLPIPIPELEDEIYYIPLQAIPESVELIAWLQGKDNFIVA